MACKRCEPLFPPVVKLGEELVKSNQNTSSFYISSDAGGFRMKGGFHRGEFLRDVPECYLCYNEMIKKYPWLVDPARVYLAGLRKFEEDLGIARTAIPVSGPAASESWYVDDEAGGHVMEFGRYAGRAIREIPLEYLLWTRASDFSMKCVTSKVRGLFIVCSDTPHVRIDGEEHLSALDNYIDGLEGYMTSIIGKDTPLLTLVTTNGDATMKTCYIAHEYNGPSPATNEEIYFFKYNHLRYAGRSSVPISALTKTLFANINGLTASQMAA